MQEKLSSAVTTLNSDNDHLILQETLPRTCDDILLDYATSRWNKFPKIRCCLKISRLCSVDWNISRRDTAASPLLLTATLPLLSAPITQREENRAELCFYFEIALLSMSMSIKLREEHLISKYDQRLVCHREDQLMGFLITSMIIPDLSSFGDANYKSQIRT